MRISISNLAWDVTNDTEIAKVLNAFSIDAIDIAPGKYFPDPYSVSSGDLIRTKEIWKERGIDIVGMQSLLFGTSGLNLFGTEVSRQKMLKHLAAICRIGSGLGATKLVFGSPKNRDCSGLSYSETRQIAYSFFRDLGVVADDYGVEICLEPNPKEYGANFMNTTLETYSVVTEVDHKSIKLQLDTGAILFNNEDYETILPVVSEVIGHIHISEPYLTPLSNKTKYGYGLSKMIQEVSSEGIITIEMLCKDTSKEKNIVTEALEIVTSLYRKTGGKN